MSASIIQRTFASDNDNQRIVIEDSTVNIPLPFGSDWTELNLILRYSVSASSYGSTITNAVLAMGICDGITAYDISGGSHMLGAGTLSPQNLTFAAGSPSGYPNYYSYGPSQGIFERVAASSSLYGVYGGSTTLYIGSPTTHRGLLGFNVIKGSPYTVKIGWIDYRSAYSTYDGNDFLSRSAYDLTEIRWGTGGIDPNIATGWITNYQYIYVHEDLTGYFDTLFFYWVADNAVLEVTDVLVGRPSPIII